MTDKEADANAEETKRTINLSLTNFWKPLFDIVNTVVGKEADKNVFLVIIGIILGSPFMLLIDFDAAHPAVIFAATVFFSLGSYAIFLGIRNLGSRN